MILLLLLCSCSSEEQSGIGNELPIKTEATEERTSEAESAPDLFTDAGKAEIESSILEAAESVWKNYDGVELGEDYGFGSSILNFTDEQRLAVAKSLGRLGYVVRTRDSDTENPDAVKNFYWEYKSEKAVFYVHTTFCCL